MHGLLGAGAGGQVGDGRLVAGVGQSVVVVEVVQRVALPAQVAAFPGLAGGVGAAAGARQRSGDVAGQVARGAGAVGSVRVVGVVVLGMFGL
ncbi:hypothetical protein [Zafaria cholistanensis]|uniref:hypothetical protein n=1 Tax=Zafaria cholistanensis TaxID=1682741 RepID=UPI00280636A8|nr:hypothetical protein [Zafaria cholistanensis]